ncbi:MAG: DUF2752 domain-containing protein [Bacteroidetes bacterium]|nr:DUF2752 domain-containing protein [Bacteroidota bacterium]
MHKISSYVLVNLIIIIAIGVVFFYSYFFYPSNHPIPCFLKLYTGKACASCGFSRAFSEYIHFNFSEGREINQKSFLVFLFFVFQFIFRILITFVTYKYNRQSQKIIIIDISLSILFFLIAFVPLLF